MDEKELIEKITKEIVEKLKEQNVINSVAVPVNTEMIENSNSVLIPSDVAKYIDHTLLKPEATASDIDTLCSEAAENKFYSVCVNTSWVERCAKNLRGTGVKVCAVVGFPLGAMSSRAKGFETRHAIEDGASEIDMVMNVGALKSRDLNLVENDIRMVRRACGQRIILKVIIETALLTDEEIVLASEIVKKAEADFVKTSTGFSTHGATVQHIALMRRTVGPKMGVKAAGGVRTFDDAVAMINAGATRLGTSGGIKIIKGQKIESGY
jgi:deoxyribose-phosphate aldolase